MTPITPPAPKTDHGSEGCEKLGPTLLGWKCWINGHIPTLPTSGLNIQNRIFSSPAYHMNILVDNIGMDGKWGESQWRQEA